MYKFGTIKKMLFLIYYIIGSLILVDLNLPSQFVGMCCTFYTITCSPTAANSNIEFSASLGGGGGGGGVEAGV